MNKLIKTIILFFASFACIFFNVNAQFAVTDNSIGGTPDNSAMLDIRSTNKGLLVPRLSLTGDLISPNPVINPAEGLLIYNIGTFQAVGFYYWSASKWNYISQSSQKPTGVFEGNNATLLTTGVLPDARLSDNVVSTTATQTLDNKTLKNPKINTGGRINDAQGNGILGFIQAESTGVNYIGLLNAGVGINPAIQVVGDDSDIGLQLNTKGTGGIYFNGNWAQQSTIVYNVKEDGSASGGPNAKGDGVTDDAPAIQYGITTGATKIIYFPAGTYLLKSIVRLTANNIHIKGAGIGKTIVKVDATFSGNAIFQGDGKSDITFEDLSITGAKKEVAAAIQLNSYPNHNKRIRFERIRINDFWGNGIIMGQTTANENHSNSEVIIKDCIFYNIYNPAHPISYTDNDFTKYIAVNLQQTTRKATITGNIIYNCSGDGIFAWGYCQTGRQSYPDEGQGEWLISNNNISRCWMGIEINGNVLNRNVKIQNNIITYSTRNGGYLLSIDSQYGDITGNTLINVERGAIEATVNEGLIANNIIKLSVLKASSNGLASTTVLSRIAAMELYGFGVKVQGNTISLDPVKDDATRGSTEYNGIKLVSRTTDPVTQPLTYEGVTDFSAYWDISQNKISGFTHKAIDATNEKIRKVFIHDNVFISRRVTESPIQIFGYDWNIENNKFDLTASIPTNNSQGVVSVFYTQTDNTNSTVKGNTIINDDWKLLKTNLYKDWLNSFIRIDGLTYIKNPYPPVTVAERAKITNPPIGMTIYQTDGESGFYTYLTKSWVKITPN